jgi:dTDP-4-dehydrorhamnose reductase
LKILIAGASGQLGICLRNTLRAHDLIPLSHVELDITRLSQVHDVLARERPDLLINAAAFTDVDGAELLGRSDAYEVNTRGPRNLAFETAELGMPIVHVSTDYVFDGKLRRPYHEDDDTNPLSIYGASKLAGERAVIRLNPKHYIVRTAWLYWELGQGFLPSMCLNATKPELRVADDQFGSPTYAPHLADAIARLIETDAFGTYHLAGSGGTSRWQFVTEAFRLLGAATRVTPVSHHEFPAPAIRPAYSVLTTAREPHIALPQWQEGVAEFVRRFARHREDLTASH